MTQKVAMTFLRGHGVYNLGEIAGFDPDHAEALEKAGVAKRAKDQAKAETIIASLSINVQDMPEFIEAKRLLEEAGQALEQRSEALDQREAHLNARQTELDLRAEALDAMADALADGDAGETVIEEVTEDGEVIKPDAAAPAGKATGLPKQGRSGA